MDTALAPMPVLVIGVSIGNQRRRADGMDDKDRAIIMLLAFLVVGAVATAAMVNR